MRTQVIHRWRQNSNMCYTSYPPQYDFICIDCKEEVRCSVGSLDKKSQCPARIERLRRRALA